MTLLDRFSPTAASPAKKSIHTFAAGAMLWALGEVTRAQFVAGLGLDDTAGNDQEQLDELVSNFIAKNTNQDKELYVHEIEATLILYRQGLINEAKAKGFLGLT